MGILSKLAELTSGQRVGGIPTPSPYDPQASPAMQPQIPLPAVNPIQAGGQSTQPTDPANTIGGGLMKGTGLVEQGVKALIDKRNKKKEEAAAAAAAAAKAGTPATPTTPATPATPPKSRHIVPVRPRVGR